MPLFKHDSMSTFKKHTVIVGGPRHLWSCVCEGLQWDNATDKYFYFPALIKLYNHWS